MKNIINNAEENNQQFKEEFKTTDSLDFNAILNEATYNNMPFHCAASNSVVKNQEAVQPVIQETNSINSIAQNNQRIDKFYDEQMERDWNLFSKTSNWSLYSVVKRNKKELFNSTAEYRMKFYQTFLDARLNAVHERVDAGVKMIKGHYRQLVSSFLMTKMSQLTQEVKEHQFSFINSMKDKYTLAATLTKYPSLQQKYTESIFNEEGRMLKFLDSLLVRFEAIVSEELKKYN